ncbi:hypothetical protein, partial [uncultured Mitsuokella sp.]|uniref:hypothetical protein n=1 Tax=uncultured Mitsuokella sp. TaxID=453120 RepID=UPI002597F7C9
MVEVSGRRLFDRQPSFFYLFCKNLLTSHLVYCIIIQVAERYGTGKRPEALIGKGLQEPKELEKRKKKLL